jgi:tetratricopeptide (TPR) repeat protein
VEVQARHAQDGHEVDPHGAFCREYDRVAQKIDFDAGSIAALRGQPPSLLAIQLAELLRRNMLTGRPHNRYAFHDLFADYTRQRADRTDTATTITQARHQLYRRLTVMVTAATDALFRQPQNAGSDAPAKLTVPAEALTWLNAATDELDAAAHMALEENWDHAATLTNKVASWLYLGDRPAQAAALYTAMHTAAQGTNDRLWQANALDGLGDVARLRDEYDQAIEYYEQAHQLYEATGDRQGQAGVHFGIARLAETQGRQVVACDCYRTAGKIYTELHLTEWANRCATALDRLGRLKPESS